MKYFWIFAVLLVFVQLARGQDDSGEVDGEINDPLVRIPQGFLRGSNLKSRNGKEYLGFQGIPYGVTERFEAPTSAPKWNGLRNGRRPGPVCLQFDIREMKVEGAEDCLRANVYTPRLPEPKDTEDGELLLPVMVHIHGGNFFYESGNEYRPDYLLDEDIVLVTFNYRLGPFGFLSTGDENLPGNYGLKDQVLLLQWVKENIEFFGGDPSRVTIFGQDSGGVSTSLHLLSPLSTGLFQRAIVQSGNALCPWAIEKKPMDVAKKMGQIIDCPSNNSLLFSECIKTWFLDPISPFAPVIEADVEGAFLSGDPETLWAQGPVNSVPLIIGMTKDEGTAVHSEVVLMNPSFTKQLNDEWTTYAPITFHYEPSALNSKLIRQKYFGDRDVGNETREELANIYTDRNFGTCTREAALYHAKSNATYLYLFSFVGEYSSLDTLGVPESDYIAHGDDQMYIFNNTNYFKGFTKNSDSEKMSHQMVQIFTSFAYEGRPSNFSTNSQSDQWQPISRTMTINPRWYEIDLKESKYITVPFNDRLDFWTKFNESGRNEILQAELQVDSSNTNEVDSSPTNNVPAPNLNLMSPPDEFGDSNMFRTFAVPETDGVSNSNQNSQNPATFGLVVPDGAASELNSGLYAGPAAAQKQGASSGSVRPNFVPLDDPIAHVMRDYSQGYPNSGVSEATHFARARQASRSSTTRRTTPRTTRRPRISTQATTARPRSVVRRLLNRIRNRSGSGQTGGTRTGFLGRVLQRIRSFFQFWVNMVMNLFMRVRGLFGGGSSGSSSSSGERGIGALVSRFRSLAGGSGGEGGSSPLSNLVSTIRSRLSGTGTGSFGATDVIELFRG